MPSIRTWILLLIAGMTLVSACSFRSAPPAEIQVEVSAPGPIPRSESGNPPFYEVFGKRYYVLPSSQGYVERGVASWYGKQFHGNRTSSGEIYNMHAMTAAHKTLPIPVYAEVKNLRNGKTVVVRINDRGPFIDNRIIDLSYAAAGKLDLVADGTGLVEVRTLFVQPALQPISVRPAEPVIAAPSPYLQVGAFAQRENAVRLQARLESAGIQNVVVRDELVGNQHLFRVRIGPIADEQDHDRIVTRLRGLGIEDTHLALDGS